MKRIYSLLALSLLAGCAQPVGQVAAPAATGAAPGSDAPATATAPQASSQNAAPQIADLKAGQYHLDAASDDTSIVVRYKAGHEYRAMTKGTLKRHLDIERTDVITADSADDRESLLKELNADPSVEFAEPDYRMQAFAAPNDPSWSQQWDMAKIAMPAAWDVTHGAATVKVAVVDTGVNYNHPDLAGQVIKGYDFVNHDADPMDDQGHGTHVSGTVAALTGNKVGVAGVAGGCKVLAVKVLGGDGSGDTSSIASGIDYAVKQGAKVINLSLGGPQPSAVLQTAVDNATKAGVLVVVAAGNDGSTTVNYPAGCANAMSVGSTESNDTRASYSTYGSTLDIAAPGSDILSTSKSGGYEKMSGTSMASPHVAGAAALIFSQHPTWTPAQVRTALETTGDPVNGFAGANIKRMNVAKALAYGGGGTAPAPTPTPAPAGDKTAPTLSGLYAPSIGTTTASLVWKTNEAADTQVEISLTNPPTSRSAYQAALVTSHSVKLANLTPGKRYYFRARSRDKAGNLGLSPTYTLTTRAR